MQKILDHEIWEDMESPIFIYSSLAQSVERTAVNRDVVGSSPTRGANFSQSLDWLFAVYFHMSKYLLFCRIYNILVMYSYVLGEIYDVV